MKICYLQVLSNKIMHFIEDIKYRKGKRKKKGLVGSELVAGL